MTRDMTKPTAGEVGVVQAAVDKFLKGQLEETLTVYRGEDGSLPGSISYLHNIVAKGIANHYDWVKREFSVLITPSDRVREASLKNVRTVTLIYRRREEEEVDREDSYAG